MTAAERLRPVAEAALAALEASRQRIDDLNVYPVPDGDTGTNLALTLRAVVDALDDLEEASAGELASELSRAALMGARGNSGVIFSQMLRGAADALGAGQPLAPAFRAACDAAYRAVRRPVEGTMLTVLREMAEEAEAAADAAPAELLERVVRRGGEALARTPELLDVLREAGVVDAGGAGLLEIVRGVHAGVAGLPLPEAPAYEEPGVEAAHLEPSRFRYCTAFVVEGSGLDAAAVERELEPLGDSLLVVGDATALKVHVHTDDPGAALAVGTRLGAVEAVEIANMHRQTAERGERILRLVEPAALTEVVAVVAGAGNRRLYESLGATQLVEGGQTMNPAAAELVAAIERAGAPEVLLLPNNPNVVMTAEQAAALASRPARVVPSRSLQAGLAALVAFDPGRDAAANEEEMRAALERVATGEVTVASRDGVVDGVDVRQGAYLGLVGDAAVAAGERLDDVAEAVVERLLAEPRDVLTVLVGAGVARPDELLQRVAARHPEVELDVQQGDQPHYPLLLAAE